MGVDDAFADLDAVEPVSPVAPEPEPAPEPVLEAELEPEAPEVPEPTPEPEPRHIPLAAHLDERERRQAAERRAEQLERDLAQFRAQAAPQPQAPAVPDPFDDPDGYRAHLNTQVEQQVSGLRFQMSEQMAKQAHGEEAVDAAVAWAQGKAQADPSFAIGYMRDPNPIDWIVRQHKRDGMISEIGDDPVAYARKIAEAQGWLTPVPAADALAPVLAQPAPKPPVPPRSLAGRPSASPTVKDVVTGPLASLGAVFQ